MMKKVSVILLVLAVVAMAAGTIVEKYYGPAYAADHVYGAWWFVLLLAFVGVAAVAAVVRGKYWQEPYKMLVYVAIPLILLGGGLTMATGRHGSVALQPGVPTTEYVSNNEEHLALPFALTLEEFEVVNYPGTPTPMDFVSRVTIDGESQTLSMNNILRHGGYRFYQEDYDGEGGSTLSVAHDPWGIGVTYAGYLLLSVGLVWMFLSRSSRFRRLLRGTALLALLLIAQTAAAEPATLPRETAQKMGEVYVLYKGRVCPMQTLAKDFTTKLFGRATYGGMSPEQVLAGWMFHYGEWKEDPQVMSRLEGERLVLVQMVASSSLLKIFPVRDSVGSLAWYSQDDPLPLTVGDEEYIFIRKWQGYCQELVVKQDFESLAQFFEKTRRYQEKQAADVLPAAARVKAERIGNTMTAGRWLPMALLVLGFVAFAWSLWGGKRVNRWAGWLLSAALLYLSALFVLRWVAGGHIPLAGGYDTMIFLSILLCVIGVSAMRRYPKSSAFGLLAVGFCQLVAMMSGANPPVTNLMPVLNSPLLTLHVAVIMMAYALFLFVALNSLAAILRPSHRESMLRTGLLMLYPAEALLAVGIMIGAVWANISWGTYWSWDPKEVWALITLIVYLLPLLHASQPIPHNSSVTIFHIYCIVAFLSVIVTYFGVNILLGGMHAYGT